jgi:hypothetical protein
MLEQGGDGAAHWASAACREFDAQLSDYLEGSGRPAVVAHAAQCAFCGAILTDVLLVRSASAELVEEEPSARVWANVRATLVAEGLIRPAQHRGRWSDWLLSPVPAAAAAALVLLSVFAVRVWVHQHHPAARRVIILAELVDPALVDNVHAMEAAFHSRSGALNPALKQAYEEDLASLDDEIRECNETLAREPEDNLSREYLVSAYTEKARVLESALELGDTDGR